MNGSMKRKIKGVIRLSLNDFLTLKGAEVAPFDPSRFRRMWEGLAPHFRLPHIIQLVGSNGKGTTGRFLAQLLYANGKNTAHFTSPHLFCVTERFWHNGHDVTKNELEKAHNRLLLHFSR